MDGIHDMGGMHGFGPITREENEPLFHHPWEGRGTCHICSDPCTDPRRLPQQHRKHGSQHTICRPAITKNGCTPALKG